MRVALISSGSGSRGGGEVYLRYLAQGLTALGHSVIALVPAAPRMDELADALASHATVRRFEAVTTYERPLRNLAAVADRAQQAALIAIFRNSGADVLHVNQQVAEDGLDFVIAAARSGRPWISTIHVAQSAATLRAQFGALRDQVTASVLPGLSGDHVAVSSTAQAQLASRFRRGRAEPRFHVVLNGVPAPDHSSFAAARAAARSEWSAEPAEVVVGMVGRIEAQKNPLGLIDLAAPLFQSGRPLRLVWIGDGAMRADLEGHARSVGAKLSVDGWRSDAATRIAGLDVFLLPSRFEGLPLALLEAMHAGVPAIANSVDGVPEAIVDGETGFVCRTDDDWGHALRTLVDNPDQRAQIGAAAQADARARFSVTSMARATAAIYARSIEAARVEA
jgi:glycosyltransferase involved in cell wall biosynthesis